MMNLKKLDNEAALKHIGSLIDVSMYVKKREGIERALKLSKELKSRDLTPVQKATLNYFQANAWADLRTIHRKGRKKSWEWEQDEVEKEIFYLRTALVHDGFNQLPEVRKCQILTNLGNLFDYIGRFVEAIEYWNKAISIIEKFPMAHGNRGIGLIEYSRMLYNENHKLIFLKHAYSDLKIIEKDIVHNNAKRKFNEYKKWLDSMSIRNLLPKKTKLDEFSLGDRTKEIRYRKWCLQNRLFLNPLNDLGPYPVAAEDILTVPSIVYKIEEGPFYHGFFNQIKQEYVSARFIYYEAINEKAPHFSDKKVLLYNTLDYPAYSIAVEKIKASFRILYSIFDKVAYFLNKYLILSIPKKRVSFKSFWFEKQVKGKGLRDELRHLENWPLRGLFWLSKDLFEDKPGFKDYIEPDAKELHNIRNHLEHKYLKIHNEMWSGIPRRKKDSSLIFYDSLAFSLYRRGFEAKNLKLVKLVRAALMYLAFTINTEEQRRKKQRGDKNIIPVLPLDIWEDDWKI